MSNEPTTDEAGREVAAHILLTPETCNIPHSDDRQCPVCDGGLAVCAVCGQFEAGLDDPRCRPSPRICRRGADGSPGCGHPDNRNRFGYCTRNIAAAHLYKPCGHRCDFSPQAPEAKVETQTNYMQVVGPNICIRCEFETDKSLPMDLQNEALFDHLNSAHPDWQLETLENNTIMESRYQKAVYDQPVTHDGPLPDEVARGHEPKPRWVGRRTSIREFNRGIAKSIEIVNEQKDNFQRLYNEYRDSDDANEHAYAQHELAQSLYLLTGLTEMLQRAQEDLNYDKRATSRT